MAPLANRALAEGQFVKGNIITCVTLRKPFHLSRRKEKKIIGRFLASVYHDVNADYTMAIKHTC